MSESLKELARLLVESKRKISEYNKLSKDETKIKEEYEHRLIDAMNAAGTNMIRNGYGTFSTKEAVMPVAEDWEAIYSYVRDNDAFFLLYKQLLPTAYRELLDAGEQIPGTTSYTKTTISINKPKT